MQRHITLGALAAVLPLASAAWAADEVRIERLAPAETAIVAGIDDFKAFESRLRASPFWGLLQTPEIQDLLGGAMGDEEDFDAALEELGLTRDRLVRPEGPVGFAIYLEPDEETGLKVPALLGLADFGAEADKAQEMFDAVLDKLARDEGIKIEQREVRGRPVRTIPIPRAPEEIDADDEEMEDEFEMFGEPDPFAAFERIESVHLARDGRRFLLASSLLGLEDALEIVDGEQPASPLAEAKDFRDGRAQLGESRDAWAVLLTPNVQPLLGPDMAGPLALAGPYIAQLLGDIRAWSFGFGIDPDDGTLSQRVGAYIPAEKGELLKLIGPAARAGDLPAFVGPDAMSYSRMNVELAKLLPLIRNIARTLPPPLAEQVELQLMQFGPALEAAFAELGPEIHVASTLREPVTAESKQTVTAIKVGKAENVRPLLDMFGPAMGLAPQDFLGGTVYADELSPVAAGLGGGWLSLGSLDAVEQVLRAAGQSDLPTLREDPGFRRAVAALPTGDVVGWGWSNLVASWRFQRESMKQQMADIMEFAGDDAEGFEEAIAEMKRVTEKVTPELLERYLGPSAWALESTGDGFVFRSLVLPATPKAAAPTPEAAREPAAAR